MHLIKRCLALIVLVFSSIDELIIWVFFSFLRSKGLQVQDQLSVELVLL
jgi:hypothetical protein